jgi:hypothetical protein
MRTATILVLASLAVAVLAGPALAADPAAPAKSSEMSKKDGQALVGMMLIPAAILLLTLPAAVVFRAGVRLPSRIADTLTDRPVVSVVLGVVNVILLVLLAQAGQVNPVLGGIAAILWLLLLVVALVGLCGAATKLARRLSRDEAKGDGMGMFALAWLTLSGVSLLPVLGFAYFLWLVSGAIGGTLLTLYGGRPATPGAAPSTPAD